MELRKILRLVAPLLLLGGCGARWTDEQASEMQARYDGRTSAGTASAGNSEALSSEEVSGRGPIVDAGSMSGSASRADGSGESPGRSGPLRCSAPSDAPGVTDAELAIGEINTLSGPIPGLGSSYLAATQAYVAYRNASGGVCGRQVRLAAGDDGADAARNRSLMVELSDKTFGLLAGIAAGGDGGADVVNAKKIPVVGTGITPVLLEAPTYYGVRPPVPDFNAETPKYRFLHDQGVRSAAVVYIAAASAPEEARRHMLMMEAAGIEVVLRQALPLTTLSYDSAARAVANSKADYLFFLHDQGGSAAMARALVDARYKPKFADYIVAYGSRFIDLAGAAAEGATSFIDTLPTEDGGTVPEQAAFLEWMDRTAPESVIDPFAALGWAGAKALFDTLEAVPGPLGREAFLTQLQASGTYDAGGLLGPIDFGAKHGRGCTIGMIVRDGRWQRLTPAQGFLC